MERTPVRGRGPSASDRRGPFVFEGPADSREYDLQVPRWDFKINGYVVAQFPNAPLLVALVAALTSVFLDEGTTAADVARSIFYVALTVWAYEEATDGVNRFRQALGVAGLLFVVVRVAQGFG
jgi:hypothetical protein